MHSNNIFNAFARGRQLGTWTYTIIAPISTELAVSLDSVKAYLNIVDNDKDAELTRMIEAATLYGEHTTKRDFINKNYRTFRDNFSDFIGTNSSTETLELRRSKLQAVIQIEYLKDNVLTLVPTTVFYNTEQTDFSELLTLEDQTWPIDEVDNRRQAVRIDFTAGYGIDETFVPADIKQAITKHVQVIYDGGLTCENPSTSLPDLSRRIYQQYRIIDFAI